MAVAALGTRVARPTDRLAIVRGWLWLVAAMVFAMVLVGGVTRLTGSGLSITEWRPVGGAIPPLSDADWERAFDLYRASPQYGIQNSGMSLAEFQVIFWWEWSHRQLGRVIGLVYALGFVSALLWARLSRSAALALFGLGLLLGLQGAVGWIMVASGLQPGMTAVEPVKLMLHLVLASVFLAAVVWMATRLDRWAYESGGTVERYLPLLVLVQIALGGLVAGSKAGWAYNTWPLMDGAIAPPLQTLFTMRPWIENIVGNVALVQLDHRLAAYVLLVVAFWHAWRWRGEGGPHARRALFIAALVTAQAGLGIATLLLSVPLWAGVAHQAVAMVLLIVTVKHAALTI